jgi:sorting and assembly machinery component 37
MNSVQSIQLTYFTETNLCHVDELPTLKSGTIWVSRYRNIVDYLRKYSAGEWNLESGLSKQQRADSIA